MRKRSSVALAFILIAFSWAIPDRGVCADRDDAYQFFKSTKDLKGYFEQRKIPIEVTELKPDGQRWLFVAAFPYSGMNTVDLYAYAYRRVSWDLFSLTYLWNSKSMKVEIKEEGEFITVNHDGIPILKINSRKAAGR